MNAAFPPPDNDSSRLEVVKLGGSLLDLPDIGARVLDWLNGRPATPLLVVGGGRRADRVRAWHGQGRIDEEQAHWLAVRAMTRNARRLTTILPGARVVRDVREIEACLNAPTARRDAAPRKSLPVLDAYRFLQSAPDVLPHSWDVTSDSIAAFAARILAAHCGCEPGLVLLKSTSLPAGASPRRCAERGLVDAHFPTAVQDGRVPLRATSGAGANRASRGKGVAVEWVNLRARPPASQRLLRDS